MMNKMKAASFVFLFLGLIAGLMASSGFANTLLTTVFWVHVSGLMILTAITLGIIQVTEKISG